MPTLNHHRFVVIEAQGRSAGRGVRGHSLAWFLRTYFGRRRVVLISPQQATDVCRDDCIVFVGMPTTLSAEELLSLPAAKMVAFDYFDQQLPAWNPELAATICDRCAMYLKPWKEDDWDFGIPTGMLPIRRYGRFTTAVKIDRISRWFGRKHPHEHDVAILGRPNGTEFYRGPQSTEKVEQRTAWVAELIRQAPHHSLWGGLVEVNPKRRPKLEEEFGSLDDLMFSAGKANFATYYRGIQRARVLLAPGGNVPWSYRHYESLYANGIVVTIDYRKRDMLIPLPKDGMVHVADGDSVLPAVDEALKLLKDRPVLPQENRGFVEQYLKDSAYSRRRPALIERFLSQF